VYLRGGQRGSSSTCSCQLSTSTSNVYVYVGISVNVRLLCFRHISRLHPKIFTDFQQSKRLTDTNSQPTMFSHLSIVSNGGQYYSRNHSKQIAITQSLLHDVIIGCGIPVSIVDNPRFVKFMQVVDPKYKLPCRQTITNTLIPDAVSLKKQRLKDALREAKSVAITVDI